MRSPLKRDRFTSFALFRFLYFYLFLSFSLVSYAFDCVSWHLKGCHPYRLALFFLPFLLSILLHPLPTSISTETARHLGKQASKQTSKAFQMKVFSVISFPPLDCFWLPPVIRLLSRFFILHITIVVIYVIIV